MKHFHKASQQTFSVYHVLKKQHNILKLMKSLILTIMALMASAGIMAQTTDTLKIDGAVGKLYTIVQKPKMKRGEKLPVVIICHGFGSDCNRPLLRAIASDVVEQGMIAIRFDFNGCGQSDGLFQNMTVPSEIDDLKHVIDWAREQPWTEDISLVGHSQGGVVVSMTAGELGSGQIKCEALLAAAAVLRDDAIRGTTQGASYDPYNLKGDYVELPPRMDGQTLKVGKNYIDTAMNLPIYETARNYTGPVLIIHGTHDRIVPYTYSERYHAELKDSQIRLISDEDHTFSNTYQQTALLVADWLHSQLL